MTHENGDDNPLVDSIIRMAHRLNISVIAEGVETEDELKIFINTYIRSTHL